MNAIVDAGIAAIKAAEAQYFIQRQASANPPAPQSSHGRAEYVPLTQAPDTPAPDMTRLAAITIPYDIDEEDAQRWT